MFSQCALPQQHKPCPGDILQLPFLFFLLKKKTVPVFRNTARKLIPFFRWPSALWRAANLRPSSWLAQKGRRLFFTRILALSSILNVSCHLGRKMLLSYSSHCALVTARYIWSSLSSKENDLRGRGILDSLISRNNWSDSHGVNAGVLREISGSFPVSLLCGVLNKARQGFLSQTLKERSLLTAIKI